VTKTTTLGIILATKLLRYVAVWVIAALVLALGVNMVLVSGDVLDSNAAGPDTMHWAREALAVFAPTPVLMIRAIMITRVLPWR
jgi:hypothetical protein